MEIIGFNQIMVHLAVSYMSGLFYVDTLYM